MHYDLYLNITILSLAVQLPSDLAELFDFLHEHCVHVLVLLPQLLLFFPRLLELLLVSRVDLLLIARHLLLLFHPLLAQRQDHLV